MIYKAILPRLKNKCKRINTICLWSGSCVEAVERAVAETDVGGVLPLGRLHSLLNIINIVMQKLGHLILSYLPKVLQIDPAVCHRLRVHSAGPKGAGKSRPLRFTFTFNGSSLNIVSCNLIGVGFQCYLMFCISFYIYNCFLLVIKHFE